MLARRAKVSKLIDFEGIDLAPNRPSLITRLRSSSSKG